MPGHQNVTVDISQHPKVINKAETPRHDVIGDLHGNTMYLIFFLIERGYLTLNKEEDYDKLKMLYDFVGEIEHESDIDDEVRATLPDILKLFHNILDNAIFQMQASKITFLGDMFADRGHNDISTLIVLLYLHNKGINYNITLSNHDVAFLYFMLNEHWLYDDFQSLMKNNASRSIKGVYHFLKVGAITLDALSDLVNLALMPHLVLFDYSEYDDTFVQWTHAPTGDEILRAFLLYFKIDIRAPLSLDENNRIKIINAINNGFKKVIKNAELLKSIINSIHGKSKKSDSAEEHPFAYITWHRYSGAKTLERADEIIYGHGHDTPGKVEQSHEKYICLDGGLGKNDDQLSGEYQIFSCPWAPKKQLTYSRLFSTTDFSTEKPVVRQCGRFTITRLKK